MSWFSQFFGSIFGNHKSVTLPPTPAKTQFTLTVQVIDTQGVRIPYAHLIWDGASPGNSRTDDKGECVLPPRFAQGFNVSIDAFSDTGTYNTGWIGCNLTKDTTEVATLTFTPNAIASPVEIPDAVYVDQRIFRKISDHSPWRAKFVSCFYALQRWDRGEDLSAWVAWTKQVGGNGWRVFCQFKFANATDPLAPNQISPVRIGEFVKWALTQGLFIELVVLTDTQSDGFNMTLGQEVTRVKNVLLAVTGLPNVFVEIKNEPFKNGGRTTEICDALGLRDKKNRPVIMATGDYNIIGNEHGFFALDYVGNHPERKDDWSAESGKTGHFVYDGWGADANSPGWAGFKGQNVAIFDDEPIGAAEVGTPGRRDANPQHWEEAGGGLGMGAAGGTGHTDAGSVGNGNAALAIPGPVQTQCITAFFTAMDFFPADAFNGDYAHDGLANHPLVSGNTNAEEIAARICGSNAYAVAAMPKDAWTAIPANGWKIVKQMGHANELVALSR